jgi:hypothetical protein
MVSSPTFLTILSQAARISSDEPQRPNVDQVVEALLQAEKSAKQERRTYQFDQLNGDWQLCFATGTRKIRQGGIALKKGYYLPKFASAQLSFSAKDNTIGNQAQLGILRLQLKGPARFQSQKNLLAFEFTRLQLLIGKTSLYSSTIRGGEAKEQQFQATPIAKLPFFAFFLITDTYIAARGRGGGLALWIKKS